MTSRAIFSGLFRKGKQIVLNAIKQKTQKAQVKAVRYRVDQAPAKQQLVRYDRLQETWHKFLPKYYFNSLASQLSRRAAWAGKRNVSLLAFMGLVVAQNQNDDEERISARLSEFIKTTDNLQPPLIQKKPTLSLDLFEFGEQIGQGCNAAVYEARLTKGKDEDTTEESLSVSSGDESISEKLEEEEEVKEIEDDVSEADSDITILNPLTDREDDERTDSPQVMVDGDGFDSFAVIDITFSDLDNEAVDNETAPTQFVVDNDLDTHLESDFVVLLGSEDEAEGVILQNENDLISLGVGDIVGRVESGTDMIENAVFNPGEEINQFMSIDSTVTDETRGKQKFDLAVKMMFNYGVESNAIAILTEMERETVPARILPSQQEGSLWENGNRVRKKHLPPHPNIVEMWGVFVDPVPYLPDCHLNFPAALPSRINPDGIGRNMTMFLVMKWYQYTLKEYLSIVHLSLHERLLLLMQLFEAVDHLGRHQIAHRDMKSDNILLDTSPGDSPRLVLSDFGCCLADTENGLQIPFNTDEVDKGGNTALMAPEIITARPGKHSVLDYSKADIWAAGALAYEILGMDNPFYSSATGRKLSSATYKETDLPPLPENVPALIKDLVGALLSRDPKKRPHPRQVADILHILLWAPPGWRSTSDRDLSSEIKWWRITMAIEYYLKAHHNHSTTEMAMKRLMIQNFNMNSFNNVLKKVQASEVLA